MRYLGVLACVLLAACSEPAPDVATPTPLTDDAIGHYDQMFVVDHDGPKAQIHLAGSPEPLWFSQVRDGVAYIKSEERTAEILAFYVNDMGAAEEWADPGAENWLDGDAAFFVLGSDAVGGMGSPEMVPFGKRDDAEMFAKHRGGQVVALADIDPADALVPVEMGQLPHKADHEDMQAYKADHDMPMNEEPQTSHAHSPASK